MDSVFGFVGKDYVIIACDSTQSRSVVMMKGDHDKIMLLDRFKLLGLSGEAGDAVQFSEYIQKNMNLYALRNDVPLDTNAAAHFTRHELATALRKNPYQVNLLIGGYDEGVGPSMYFIDYMSSMHNMKTAAHGYAGYFILSIMDRLWRPDLSYEDGLDLIRKCCAELQKRFTVNYPNFIVKVVGKDGAKTVATDEWNPSTKP